MASDELPVVPGIRRALQEAEELRRAKNHPRLGLFHLALVVVQNYPALAAEGIAGTNLPKMRQGLEKALEKGNVGPPLNPDEILQEVRDYAAQRGQKAAFEWDLVVVLGRHISPEVARGEIPSPEPQKEEKEEEESLLERFGYCLTKAAAEGKLRPVVGREEEIESVLQVLCRKIKRNPALVGPAGVGKTAIVEGLAQRIVQGNVPEPLRDVPVWTVPVTALMTGASYGTYFERVEKLLREAAEKKIILFIDEAHHFLNVGYSRTDNLGNLLKPVLARGDFACILATTHDEYRQFIQKDKALDRRFQTVYVAEPSAEETLSILRSFAEAMGWTVAEDLLRQIVIWAGQWIRHRYFPDKALDVLDQSMAVALTRQRELDRSIIQEVICRMLQVPLDWSDRLARLEEYLQPRVFLDPAGLRSLAERLRFTVPGYDVRKHRPNAVVLVLGPEGFGDGALGRELSQALYGTPDRVIDIDLSRFTEDHDITGLLGAQPSYVGYGDRVPLHDLLFQPWSVVVFKNVDQCHPTIRETIAAALEAGYFTDGMNNRLFVGDTVCIFTLVEDLEFSKPIGFTSSPQAKAVPAENWAQRLGSLAEAVDITLRAGLPNEEALRRWLETALLGDLQKRLASQGIQVLWEPALVDWLLSQRQTCQSPRDWERLLEERLWPHVGPVLARMASQGLILRLQVHQGPAKSGQGEEEVSLKVEAEEKVEEGPNPESPSGEEEKALPT